MDPQLDVWPRIDDPWMAAGAEKVLLPSGTAILWEPTVPVQLMVRGVMPGYLREMALQFGGADLDPDKLPPDDAGKWRDTLAEVIIASCRAVALPGAESFEPYRLTREQVDDQNPRMPRPDLEAMQHLAMHLRTPLHVTAVSRIAEMERQLRAAVEASASDETLAEMRRQQGASIDRWNRIIEREADGAMLALGPFRSDGRGADPGPNGGEVERPPVVARDHLGSGGRPRVRRRAGAATGSRGKARARTTES